MNILIKMNKADDKQKPTGAKNNNHKRAKDLEGVVYLPENGVKQGEFQNDEDFYNLLNYDMYSEHEKGYDSSDSDDEGIYDRETCCNNRYSVSSFYFDTIIKQLLEVFNKFNIKN